MRIITASLTLLALVLVPAALADGGGDALSLRGTVSTVTDTSIAVSDGDHRLSCGWGSDAPTRTGIAVGDRVAIACRRSPAGPLLVALERLEPKLRILEIEGSVAEASTGSVTVKARSGRSLTCLVPSTLAIATGALVPGDVVKAQCGRRGDADPVLLRLKKRVPEADRRPADPADPGMVDIAGGVTAVGGAAVTIANDGRSLTCKVTPATAAAAATLAVGVKAGMVCREGNILVLRKKDERTVPAGAPNGQKDGATSGGTTPPATSAPAPPTMTFGFRGPLASFSPDRVFVTTDGGSRSCFVPEALRPAVAVLTVGAVVKIGCAGADLAHAQLTAVERG